MKDTSAYVNKFPQSMRLSWEDVNEMVWDVACRLKEDGYDPDVIIAVARGGLVPARILADYLQKKYICTLQMAHWSDDDELTDDPNLVYPLPEIDLSGKKVLVVDDISDEGRTMQKVYGYIKDKVSEIRTFDLVTKPKSVTVANYCPRVLDDWRWVFFPWSIHEDLLVFTEKVLQISGGATIEEIIRILGETTGVEVSISEISKVLQEMQLDGEVKEGDARQWMLI